MRAATSAIHVGVGVIAVLLVSASASAFASTSTASETETRTAADVLFSAYQACVRHGSFDCVKPKMLAFLGEAINKDTVRITRDLAVVRRSDVESNLVEGDLRTQMAAVEAASDPDDRRSALRNLLLDGVDAYLASHELRVSMPQELADAVKKSEEDSLARALSEGLPTELRLPLEEVAEKDDDEEVSARHKKRPLLHLLHKKKKKGGLLRKVVLPFLLGLKFKTTALVPLALSLIALKTWKALTLGLLSLVLSGAMVIFRFTKPKVVNYEVFHYPQSGHHVDHYDHHGYARDLAYHAHKP